MIFPVATLSGDELGEFAVLADLRRAAVEHYRQHFQQTSVCRADLGTIRFTRIGRDHVKSLSADPDKLKVVPALREVVLKGRYVRSAPNTKPSKIGIVRYHYITGDVALAGTRFPVWLTLAEDRQGNAFYDFERKKEAQEKTGATTSGEPELTAISI